MKNFCRLALFVSLALTCGLAWHRFTHGQPALQDFLAFQDSGPLPFIRPPFYQPLRGLPVEVAAALWLALNAAAGFGFGLWAMRRSREPAVALLLAVFVPSIVALSVGQDSLLLLAVLAGVFESLESERPLAAGMFLALLWVKFVWLPAFFLLLLMRREWRALAAWGAGTVLLWAPAIRQVPEYATLLWRSAAAPLVVPCRPCMPNLHALIPDAWLALAASVVLLAVLAPRFRGPLPGAFALAAAAALLTSQHAHVYDCVLLFLAVVLTMRPDSALRTPAKWACAWAISPLPYLLAYWGAPWQIVPALTALVVVGSLVPESRRAGPAG
jgi:hypothetical protein